MSLAGGPIIVTSSGRIAFYVAILEPVDVLAKNEMGGKTTVFDDCMVLMTSRPCPLVRESFTRWRKIKIKETCKNIVCIMSK